MCLCVRALFILDFYLVFEAPQSLWWTEKIRAEERRWINERTADQLVLNLPWWIFNIWTETELTVERVNGSGMRVCLIEADRRKSSGYVLMILHQGIKTVDKHFLFWGELINCLGIINWLNCLQQLISGNVAPSANSMGWDNINITRARSALQYLAFAVSSFLVHCLQVNYFNFINQFCVFACVWQAAVKNAVFFSQWHICIWLAFKRI